MNARPFVTALVLMGGISPASELHWQNGEWVGGHFVGAADGHVIWRTPMLSEDFQVSMDVLKRVNRFKTDATTAEAFSIRLADGSRLYGSVTALDARTMSVKSARFGSIRVLRDAVVSVQRLKADGMPLPTLCGTSGWTEPSSDNNSPAKEKLWRMVPGAALQQVGWNHRATLPIETPEQVEMQFTLSSTVRPEFKIELKASADERVIVETWMDDVVLQGRVFESVEKLSDDARRITLTLFWNRATGLCAIFGADGKKLAETTKTPVDAEPAPEAKNEAKKPAAKPGGGGLFGALIGAVQGAVQVQVRAAEQKQSRNVAAESNVNSAGLTLLNKGPDLTLEALRIRGWDGTLPTDLTDVRPRIELTDGHYLKARALRADAASLTVRDLSGKESSLPWDKVLAVEMTPAISPFFQAAPPLTEMWFTDGEWINGTLLHVRNEVAAFITTFSETPVNFKITDLHHLEFKGFESPAKKIDLAKFDTLTINKNVLHGTLDAGGEAQPRWKPVGALKPVALVSSGEMEITRAAAEQPAGIRSESLFYLHDGDVLPGKLRAIDAKQVDLESDVAAVKHLSADQLQAIQFGGASLNLDGFEDPGWQRVRGGAKQVKRSGKAGIEFNAGGSWGHPSFMQVNEINFTLFNTDGFSALRMRLFCDGINPAAPSTNLLFGHMGSEVCFGLESNGDLLRGVIEAATAEHFAIRSGLETVHVPRDRVKASVWLIKPAEAVSAAFEALDKEGEKPVITHLLLLNNGGRLGLKVNRFAEDAVFGGNPLLGDCRVPLTQIYMIRSSEPAASAAMAALREWQLKFAPEPVLPATGGQSSPLLNQDAKPFKLPLLAGEDFDLAQEKGKVIVLDFWATWCGPCIKSLPLMIDEMSAFDPKKVRFVGINQAEDKETVKTFLETRGWKFEVALDASQRVGQNFGVEGIPHTVVIGPDGKVAFVKTGFESDGAKQVAEAVRNLLAK